MGNSCSAYVQAAWFFAMIRSHSEESPMSLDDNLWYVKTDDGDVHRVTLDQLDEAFQAGRIDENVMVLGGDATRWTKLGQLAGLDEPQRAAPLASSLRPVSMDLSLGVDENVFRRKSRKGLVLGSFVAVLAAFGGFLALNRGHLGNTKLFNFAAAAAVAPPAPPADPPPGVADPPAPAPAAPDPTTTTAPASASPADANAAASLSDAQKAKLAAADKALELKSKSHKKGHAAASRTGGHGSSKYKAQGFTTGGNKFDPLNASF